MPLGHVGCSSGSTDKAWQGGSLGALKLTLTKGQSLSFFPLLTCEVFKE